MRKKTNLSTSTFLRNSAYLAACARIVIRLKCPLSMRAKQRHTLHKRHIARTREIDSSRDGLKIGIGNIVCTSGASCCLRTRLELRRWLELQSFVLKWRPLFFMLLFFFSCFSFSRNSEKKDVNNREVQSSKAVRKNRFYCVRWTNRMIKWLTNEVICIALESISLPMRRDEDKLMDYSFELMPLHLDVLTPWKRQHIQSPKNHCRKLKSVLVSCSSKCALIGWKITNWVEMLKNVRSICLTTRGETIVSANDCLELMTSKCCRRQNINSFKSVSRWFFFRCSCSVTRQKHSAHTLTKNTKGN